MLSKANGQGSPGGPKKELNIIYVPIRNLTLNPNNPRIHDEKQLTQIAHSIQIFGFNVPVLVDSGLHVIAGHGRVQAAGMVGLTELPTICLDHLTDAQVTAFRIADNRLTENATWDDKLLAQQLKVLSEAELDFSVEVTGFEIGEIDVLIEGAEPEDEAGADLADCMPDLEAAVPVTQSGDLWSLASHRLFCGNSLCAGSYSALMDGRRAAMVITDPPYNVPIQGHATGLGKIQHKDFKMAAGEMSAREFTDFLLQTFGHLAEHSADGSLHFIFMDWRHVGELLSAGTRAYSEFKNICVWVKDNAGMGSLYRSQHELIFVFKKGKNSHRNNVQLGQYGRYRTNVWQYPGVNSFSRKTDEGNLLELHPTVKPVALIADAIMDCTARGEIVLDPFLGSGTAIVAAERTGRVCCGIELDPVYVDTAIRRWQTFTGQTAVHVGSRRKFTELEEEKTNVRD